ncbi:phage regulatory CII family protein [Enterobacter asburiae]|nr:phage regulatory CII family protein [Enterobacter asburiae]
MFDYNISKHPHFDEACRAFALRHNMAKLADRAGMNVQTLRNKLNPEQPHQLTAPDIWLLTDITEDSTLIDGFLAQIHCLPCVPLNEVASEKMPHYLLNATAEIGRVAASAVSGEHQTTTERRQVMRIEIMIDKEQKISQALLEALEFELYRNLRPLYLKTAIRIRKGNANGVELSGLKLDEDKNGQWKLCSRSGRTIASYIKTLPRKKPF